MKVIIAGSRTITGERAQELIRQAISDSGWAGEISEVVYGGCRGIDSAAYDVAFGVWPAKLFRADWASHGKAAGPFRNAAMAEYADGLILVWDGSSRGSASMKREAEKRGLKIFELIVKGG